MKTLLDSQSEEDALFLLEFGADPAASSASFGNALHIACFKLYFHVADKILAVWRAGLKQKCSKNQNTPLHALAGSFDKNREVAGQMLNLMLFEGAEVDQRNVFNHTFVSHAINLKVEGLLDHLVQYSRLNQQNHVRGIK